MQTQLTFHFAKERAPTSTGDMASPSGYKGLYAFHKYWGKKPHEPIAYIIEQLTEPGKVVLDPFVGSGTTGREALLLSRKFIGFDINPTAVELCRLLIHPPHTFPLKEAVQNIEQGAKAKIYESYLLENGDQVATHYLWDGDELQQVWIAGSGVKRQRKELVPTRHDLALFQSFSNYKSKHIRQPRFFSNTRINTDPRMTLDDLLTGRAQRNLDILIEAIERCPAEIIPSLKLCLTAASGQMTKMVFAVTGRGKTSGQTSAKVEVGSWVIGYWRPPLHFEVNVWNCFERRTSKLLKAVRHGDPLSSSVLGKNPMDVIGGDAQAHITIGDSLELIDSIPDKSVHLIITDPPHSDRVPYLELSEFWSSILNVSAQFKNEIVFSNAKERSKSPESYTQSMNEFFSKIPRVLHPNGYVVVLFNARQKDQWAAFSDLCITSKDHNSGPMRYLGHFPCVYSAGSVVQDNREGSLKNDYAIVMARSESHSLTRRHLSGLDNIAQWSTELPEAMQRDQFQLGGQHIQSHF